MPPFTYTSYPQKIIFGAGVLDRLPELVAQNEWARVLLITTRSYRANRTIARIESLLGEKLVAVFEKVQPHVPQSDIDQTVALVRQHNADLLFALGGGSAIGVAKGTSYSLSSLVSNPLLPILAIPTTYAGSEMTPVFGVTRERDGVTKKETTTDVRIVPRMVLYDPELTLDLPRNLTASTAINALAHCVEAVYSVTRNPLSTAAALYGARLIFNSLVRSVENDKDLKARSKLLQGAYLAGACLANVAMGLHHGVCHVLGGAANVPHGIANAIILPHAIRFNADVCANELALLAEMVGVPQQAPYRASMDLVLRIEELITRLNLPTRLREVGVSEAELPKLAALAFQNKTVQNNPKRITNVAALENLLRAAW